MAYEDEGSVTERMDRPQKTGRQVKDRKKKRNRPEGLETGSTGAAYSPQGGNEYDQMLNQFGGGGDNAFGRLLQYLMAQPPQEQWSDVLRTKAQLANPEKYARDQYMGQTYAAPFSGAPGAAFTGRQAADIMTPEEIMASQGRTAANQWASLRQPLTAEQKVAGEFDPEELRRLNAMRQRTYI